MTAMNILRTFILTLALSLLALPGWSADLTIDDLVKRNGLFYKKFTNEPFTGNVSGIQIGKFKNGKRVGTWKGYYDNGQISFLGNYEGGKRHGSWETYHSNGHLFRHEKYKDGKPNGEWKSYHYNGSLRGIDNYKDGELEGNSEAYWDNGQLYHRGTYKGGKREGYWVQFFINGNPHISKTGTYINGVKQD